MLGSEIKLSQGANSESIDGHFIGKTEYRWPVGIVSHGDFGVNPFSHHRVCSIFLYPKPKSAGVIFVANCVGEVKKWKQLSDMANALYELYLRRLNGCLSVGPIGSVFRSSFGDIRPTEAIRQSGSHSKQGQNP